MLCSPRRRWLAAVIVALLASVLATSCVRGGFGVDCAEGARCDDGDPCTDNDRCQSGQCRGDAPIGFCRDLEFGAAGVAWVQSGAMDNGGFALGALTIDPAGQLWVAGTGPGTTGGDFLVTRLDSAGRPDASFGEGGQTLIDVGGDDSAKALVLTDSGAIVAGSSQGKVGLAALTQNGTLDASFGTAGIHGLSFGAVSSVANSVRRDGAARLLIGGHGRLTTNATVVLLAARLDNKGKLDGSFGGKGWISRAYPRDCFGGIVESDDAGRLYLAGNHLRANFQGFDVVISRHQPGGTLDLSWGNQGSLTLAPGGPPTSLHAMHPVGDTLLLAGTADAAPQKQGVVSRLSAGLPDGDFGDGGRVVISQAYGVDLRALLPRPDGRVWVAGAALDPASSDLLLAELSPSGALLRLQRIDTGSAEERIWSLVAGPEGTIFAKAHVVRGGHEDIAVLRFIDRPSS